MVNPSRDVLLDGAILITGDKIIDTAEATALLDKYLKEHVDLTGRIIIPGLISTHMHTAQTLLTIGEEDVWNVGEERSHEIMAGLELTEKVKGRWKEI